MTGAEIKQKRTELGLSQYELALLLNVKKPVVGRWERQINAEKSVKSYNAERLAIIFSKTKDDLLVEVAVKKELEKKSKKVDK